MSQKTLIAVVEDNPPQRLILTRLLSGEFNVVEFSSGEDFLASQESFRIVLLDIGLPGVDGYEVCRRLRTQPGRDQAAVIFVSGHDTVEDRVAAYDAGADDFLVKPVSANELRHKVRTLAEHQSRLEDLAAESSNAQQVALNAMVNLGDQGVIIDFQRKTAMAQDLPGLAGALVKAINLLGLRGTVQVRGSQQDVTLSTTGSDTPLQSAVMAKLRSMGRLFEFKARLVINYDRVSIVIQNMPTEDTQRMGRYRDHLAVLAESADISVDGVEAVAERNRMRAELASVASEMGLVIQDADRHWSLRMQEIQDSQLEALSRLEHRLSTMTLSESQEQDIYETVRESQESLILKAEGLKAVSDSLPALLGRVLTLSQGR